MASSTAEPYGDFDHYGVGDVALAADPTDLDEISSIRADGVTDIHLSGDNLYIAHGLGGLRMMDVSSPESPSEIRRISDYNVRSVMEVTLPNGDRALALLTPNGVLALDIDDASQAIELGRYETTHGTSMSFSDGLLHLSEGIRGLSTLSVTREGIRRINSSDIEFAGASAVAGSYAYVTDTSSLRVLEILIPEWLR